MLKLVHKEEAQPSLQTTWASFKFGTKEAGNMQSGKHFAAHLATFFPPITQETKQFS